jgi:hypothetical protein
MRRSWLFVFESFCDNERDRVHLENAMQQR